MAENYSIKLGIDFNDKELKNIRTQLTNLTDNTHRIRIDLDNSRLLKQIEHAKKELKELNSAKGNQPSLTVNTQSLEKSLSRVADVIEEVRKSLGTLDDKSGMKSLLSSVNQIATALGKVENESDNLVKSLSTLSKKDFSINFDLKMGGSNPVTRNTNFGRKVRNEVLPELQKQVKAYEDYFAKYYEGKYRKGSSPLSGLLTGSSVWGKNKTNVIDINQRMADPSNLEEQIKAYKQYISIIKEAASLKGIDVSSVASQFSTSAEKLVKDTIDIKTGAKEAEENLNKLKGIFGGSLDVEGLSGQLQPIITDLGEIKTALQSLSSNNSIDGLTQSFNRLSETLEKLTANLTLAKNTLDAGFTNAAPVDNAVKAAQQTGQKIGEAITQSTKEHIKLNDVVEKETRALMKEYGISAKNKTAKDDIKGALTNYVNEIKSGGTIVNDELFGSFNTADAALRKVTDSIARHKKEVIELDTLYEDLLADIKSVNKGKGATKVRLSDMRAEWGDDYKTNKDLLGSWFSDKYTDGIGIDSWVKSKSWSSLLDLSGSHQDIANQLVELVKKAKTKTSYSGDELFKEGFLNIDDVEARVKESAVNISAAEQKMAQSSTESANAIAQAETKKQQAYEETKQKLDEVNRAIAEHNDTITDPAKMASIGDMGAIQAYMNELDTLEQKKKELESTLKTLEVSDTGVENLENGLKQVESSAESASDALGQISGFDSAQKELKNLSFNTKSLDSMIDDFNKLGVQVKDISHTLNKDGSITFSVRGIDKLGNAVKAIKTLDSSGNFKSFSSGISQSLSESDKFIKQQKKAVADLTNQINQLNRSAIDQNANRPIKDSTHLDTLEGKYNEIISAIQRMGNASSNTFDEEANNVRTLISEYKSLTKEFRNAENVSSKMKGTDFASGLDIAKNDLEKFKAQAKDFPQITATIEKLDRAIEGVGDKSSLDSFTDKLKVARAELAKVKAETIAANRKENVGIDVSGATSRIADIQRISPEIDNFKAIINGAEVTVESLLNDLSKVNTAGDFSVVNKRLRAFEEAAKAAGIAVTETFTKISSVNKIKNKLSDTGFNGFEQELRRAHEEAEKLESSTPDLEAALKRLDAAMDAVYSANQANDTKRLVVANEEYENSLKQVYSQLKLLQQEEKQAYNAEILAQKKASLSSDMEIWLKENTRAARDFGEEVRKLQSSLDGLDDNGVRLAGKQFNNIKKQAQAMGKTGLTVFDKLKAKAKEYMAYLSAAELFMYAEQALRAMFDTVKEIDTAMTGLYRVTDLTSAEYDTLFNNMISSAKEYGATLNDIINATTDWVRAGFDANTSLGLAEVTTMYQHISDLDYDTAAENLITAYNGFKDELNGAFAGDQVAAVEYIADIFNELDNNFAVTSAGLGEALTRSASALDLAGNSIQETAG